MLGLPLNTRDVATKEGDAILSVLNRISTGIVRVDAEVGKPHFKHTRLANAAVR